MQFLKYMFDLGHSLLESESGCTARTFNSYIQLMIFFGYKTLAANLSANCFVDNHRYKCHSGILKELFSPYL